MCMLQVDFCIITDKSEPYPALNSLIATLTTGPVGPSDRIGYSNITLIMR